MAEKHEPNTNELTISGLTLTAWKGVLEIAGNTCVVNGGSKKKPCDACLENAEKLMRSMKTIRPEMT